MVTNEQFINLMNANLRARKGLPTLAALLNQVGLLDHTKNFINTYIMAEKQTDAHLLLTTYKFNFLRATTTCAGRVKPGSKIFELHPQLLVTGREKELKSTVLHELAHVFDRLYNGKGHGPSWRRLAIALGDDGSRCHNYEFLKRKEVGANHKYVCKDCGWEHHTLKRLKTVEHRFHGACKHKSNGGKLNHYVLN